jgi:hypothetical protein
LTFITKLICYHAKVKTLPLEISLSVVSKPESPKMR